jgi:hypothetical protein
MSRQVAHFDKHHMPDGMPSEATLVMAMQVLIESFKATEVAAKLRNGTAELRNGTAEFDMMSADKKTGAIEHWTISVNRTPHGGN